MKMQIIGVSGDECSFSEAAAIEYIKKNNISHYKLKYLIDMEGVLSAIHANKIDIGVFPIANKNSGIVWPAMNAMGKYLFTPIDVVYLNVEQCLFAKQKINLDQVSHIYSFAPAIEQCKKFVQKYKKIPIVDYGDMAKAARDLASGKLPESAAVLGSQNSAKLYGLHLIKVGIQDVKINTTMFIVVEPYKTKLIK